MDAARSLRRTRERDNAEPSGPLHGIPIGIKDVIGAESARTGCRSASPSPGPRFTDRRALTAAAALKQLI